MNLTSFSEGNSSHISLAILLAVALPFGIPLRTIWSAMISTNFDRMASFNDFCFSKCCNMSLPFVDFVRSLNRFYAYLHK